METMLEFLPFQITFFPVGIEYKGTCDDSGSNGALRREGENGGNKNNGVLDYDLCSDHAVVDDVHKSISITTIKEVCCSMQQINNPVGDSKQTLDSTMNAPDNVKELILEDAISLRATTGVVSTSDSNKDVPEFTFNGADPESVLIITEPSSYSSSVSFIDNENNDSSLNLIQFVDIFNENKTMKLSETGHADQGDKILSPNGQKIDAHLTQDIVDNTPAMVPQNKMNLLNYEATPSDVMEAFIDVNIEGTPCIVENRELCLKAEHDPEVDNHCHSVSITIKKETLIKSTGNDNNGDVKFFKVRSKDSRTELKPKGDGNTKIDHSSNSQHRSSNKKYHLIYEIHHGCIIKRWHLVEPKPFICQTPCSSDIKYLAKSSDEDLHMETGDGSKTPTEIIYQELVENKESEDLETIVLENEPGTRSKSGSKETVAQNDHTSSQGMDKNDKIKCSAEKNTEKLCSEVELLESSSNESLIIDKVSKKSSEILNSTIKHPQEFTVQESNEQEKGKPYDASETGFSVDNSINKKISTNKRLKKFLENSFPRPIKFLNLHVKKLDTAQKHGKFEKTEIKGECSFETSNVLSQASPLFERIIENIHHNSENQANEEEKNNSESSLSGESYMFTGSLESHDMQLLISDKDMQETGKGKKKRNGRKFHPRQWLTKILKKPSAK